MKAYSLLLVLLISVSADAQEDTNVIHVDPELLKDIFTYPYQDVSPPMQVKKGQHQYEVIGETYSRFDIKDGWFSDSLSISPGGTSHRFFNPYQDDYGQKDKNYRDGTFRYFHYTNGYLTQGHHKLQDRELYGDDFFEGKFVNGVPEGFFKGYNESNHAYMCGNFKNGEKVGEWKLYRKSPDQPYLIYSYELGSSYAHQVKVYDRDNGHLTSFNVRIDAHTDSLVLTFNSNGDTLSRLELTNPEEKIYTYKEWYPSGVLKVEGKKSKPSSVSIKETGTWIYYNEDGSVAEKKEFE